MTTTTLTAIAAVNLAGIGIGWLGQWPTVVYLTGAGWLLSCSTIAAAVAARGIDS